MRVIETKVFKFEELNEEAQQVAVRNYEFYDCWGDERDSSYKAAKEIFDQLENIEEEISGSRLIAWIDNNLSHYWTDQNYISKNKEGNVSNCYYSHKYNSVKKRISQIYRTNNLENCPLTGYTYDFNFLFPIIEFLRKPTRGVTNIDLVDNMPSFESVSQEDYNYYSSEEFITEELENNEYEFTEEGNIF